MSITILRLVSLLVMLCILFYSIKSIILRKIHRLPPIDEGVYDPEKVRILQERLRP